MNCPPLVTTMINARSPKPVILLMFFLTGCAAAQPIPTIPATPSHRVEDQDLPPDPESEKIEGLPAGDWVEPMEEGSCVSSNGKIAEYASTPCPAKSGIAASEARAARDKLYRIRYKELRLNYTADKRVWVAQRELYETRLQDANQLLQDSKPDWFQKHALELGVLSGIVLGAGMAIGIVYGVAPAFQSAN